PFADGRIRSGAAVGRRGPALLAASRPDGWPWRSLARRDGRSRSSDVRYRPPVVATPLPTRRGRAVLDAAPARAARGLSDHGVLLACVAVTVALRLPFLAAPLGIDEGGYA